MRMVSAGVVPVTWLQVMLELQRDWARSQTYDAVMEVAMAHGGAYGQGIAYAREFRNAHAVQPGTAIRCTSCRCGWYPARPGSHAGYEQPEIDHELLAGSLRSPPIPGSGPSVPAPAWSPLAGLAGGR